MAVLRLVEEEKCVVEGAGATGLAAAIAGKLDHLKGKRYATNFYPSFNSGTANVNNVRI